MNIDFDTISISYNHSGTSDEDIMKKAPYDEKVSEHTLSMDPYAGHIPWEKIETIIYKKGGKIVAKKETRRYTEEAKRKMYPEGSIMHKVSLGPKPVITYY